MDSPSVLSTKMDVAWCSEPPGPGPQSRMRTSTPILLFCSQLLRKTPQPPRPSLLMCVGCEALDVCLSLSKTVKPQFSLWTGILAVSKLIWRVGAFSPACPVRANFYRPAAGLGLSPGNPFISET